MYLLISVFYQSFPCCHNCKSLNNEIRHEQKYWTHKIPTRKKIGPMKYSREKILYPGNNHEKNIWSHKITMKKNFRPTKCPPEKTLDQQTTHKKKILNPRNTYKGMIARWHYTQKNHDGRGPTKFSTLVTT